MTEATPERLASLVERMAARDERAFAEFYDSTSDSVFGLLVRVLKDRTLAEEVAQNVYMQAWRGAASFDPERGSAWSWLVVQARSRAIDAARSSRSYGSAMAELEARPSEHPLGSRTRSPEADAEFAERRRMVRRAMTSLTPDQVETIEAAFFEGWSHREIAERTGTPLGTVKGRVRSALATLQKHLRSELGEAAGGT